MSNRVYPRTVWVLMPSFKPSQVEVVEAHGWSYRDYGDVTAKGKVYAVAAMHETREQAIATGECDIDDEDGTIDTKVAWDLSTFPALSEDAHDNMYMWQGVAYMRLYKRPRHTVAFVMLDTPDDLLKPWDQIELHKMEDRIPLHMRVTTITYERDMALEEKMINKLAVCREFYSQIVAQIKLEKGFNA